MDELKPCPFCGEQPELDEWHYGDAGECITFMVQCKNENCTCRPFTQEYIRVLPAIEAWNRRAEDGK